MSKNVDDIEWKVRSSQLVRTFAPGAVYDNTKDSVMILGTDYWDPVEYGYLHDTYLLSQIRRKSNYFANLKGFASVSSPTAESSVPVTSFPTWGVCQECHMLQRRHGHGDRHEFDCRSKECGQRTNGSRTRPAKTVPVRFIMACKSGHIDDFPFYEWVHNRGDKSDKCPESDACLYLEDRKSTSSSLDSKFVVCKRCNREKDMGMALTKTGILHVTGMRCSGRRPWLEVGHVECNQTAIGMLKGASNIYFPMIWSAITIPPFSDELSHMIKQKWDDIEKLAKKPHIFEEALGALFEVKAQDNPDGRYTIQQVVEKYRHHKSARDKNDVFDILELEFKELDSGFPVEDKEFKTTPVDVPDLFTNDIHRITLVEKLRQVVAVTGFTRLHPPDPSEPEAGIAQISSKPPEWLPAVENRGEGIFLSLNPEMVRRWESLPKIQDRMKDIFGITGDQKIQTMSGRAVDARYVMLHSLSHLLIHSMSGLAGYSTSDLQERIYSSETMAGILIFTSSPSSDGSLGGLVEQGRTDRIGQIIRMAIDRSASCSSDPLCSFNRPNRQGTNHGAACHACLFLPETSCESMNEFLDRSTVYRTLDGKPRGFFMDDWR